MIEGKALSPVLVVGGGAGTDIADGFHRVSLVYRVDPYGEVPQAGGRRTGAGRGLIKHPGARTGAGRRTSHSAARHDAEKDEPSESWLSAEASAEPRRTGRYSAKPRHWLPPGLSWTSANSRSGVAPPVQSGHPRGSGPPGRRGGAQGCAAPSGRAVDRDPGIQLGDPRVPEERDRWASRPASDIAGSSAICRSR